MDWWVNIHTEINSRNSTIFQQFTIIELHLCCFFLSCRCLLNSNCPRKLKTLIFEYRRYSSCLGLMIVANSLPVGYYGLLANKGATAFSIMVDNSPLTFVCCHLSPHSHNVKLRNQELERYFLRSNNHCRIFNEIEFSNGLLKEQSNILLVFLWRVSFPINQLNRIHSLSTFLYKQ